MTIATIVVKHPTPARLITRTRAMRVTKEKAAENREQILTEAARLFRERGVSAVGMDALAAAAGMTHGSLYSQFDSKEHLATEALGRAFEASAVKYAEVETLSAYVERYLSPRHRDAPGSGCAIATLGCEVPRQGNAMRQTFTEGLRRMVGRLTRLLGPKARRKRENEALAIAATLVGGMILARAVDDRELSDRILVACRVRLNRA
jgi:TetR/AcrR family transcriptional regulator, transcriptional repressor for nem operon